MADSRVQGAIDFLVEQINATMAELAEKKKLANSLAASAGCAAVYEDIEDIATASRPKIRSDQFANHSAPSAAARDFLEWHGKEKGSVGLDEIYDALVQGGYGFQSASPVDAKNGLRIAMGKDGLVHKLANGTYGLKAWYPNAKTTRSKRALDKGEVEASPEDEAEPSGSPDTPNGDEDSF